MSTSTNRATFQSEEKVILHEEDGRLVVKHVLPLSNVIDPCEITLIDRYPSVEEGGYVINDLCLLTILCLDGIIVLTFGDTGERHTISTGDVVQIPAGQKYFWEPVTATVKLFVVSFPEWNDAQKRFIN